MKVLDLFAGIGGFSLGLERAGMETVAFCEIEDYPRKVLAKHWPGVPIYEDVKELTSEKLRADGIIGIDVITAGFPCQDISVAGKGAGIEGERSGLFYEIIRLIGDLRKAGQPPKFVVLENVAAILNRGLGEVLIGLESVGYDCEWHCIPASHLGAPHRRDRWWCVCYPDNHGFPAAEITRGAGTGSYHSKTGSKSACEPTRPNQQQPSVAYPNDAGIRTPTSDIDIYGTPGNKGRSGITRPEPSGQREDVANTNQPGLQGHVEQSAQQTGAFARQGEAEYVAYTKSEQCNVSDNHTGISMEREQVSESGDSCRSEVMANTNSERYRGRACEERGREGRFIQQSEQAGGAVGREVEGCGSPYREDVADTNSQRGRSGNTGRENAENVGQSSLDPGRNAARMGGGQSKPNMGFLAHGLSAGLARSRWLPEPGVGRVAAGIPDRTARLKALGNSLIPQMPELIGRAIMAIEADR